MAKTKLPADIVVFEDSQGNTISNDPRYLAMQTLGLLDDGVDEDAVVAQGVSFDQSQPAERNAAASKSAGVPEDNDEELDTEDEDEDEYDGPDYSDVTGSDLIKLAKERGIATPKGIKAGEVRSALIEQDKAAAEDDEDDEDDDESDESDDDNANG